MKKSNERIGSMLVSRSASHFRTLSTVESRGHRKEGDGGGKLNVET